jgi:hypothetical protein
MRVPCRARVYRDGRTERDDGGAKGNRRQSQGLVERLEESYSLNCLNLCERIVAAHSLTGRGRAERERERATATLCPNQGEFGSSTSLWSEPRGSLESVGCIRTRSLSLDPGRLT